MRLSQQPPVALAVVTEFAVTNPMQLGVESHAAVHCAYV